MIIGDVEEIAIQLEYVLSLSSPSGIFNFVIDDEFIPGKGTVIDLYVVISSLKDSIKYSLEKKVKDIGNINIENLDFSDGAPENMIWLDAGELSDYGCVFWLGFDGDIERFFYSTDYENTIKEKIYSKGTVEKLINALPDAENLEVKKTNDMVKITVTKDY